ncbi:MAG: glycosyltransferase [Clostridia bacterium]|nr:glycosyltransferase [Clostridia bacterium]
MKKVVFFQLEAGQSGGVSGVNRAVAKALAGAGWQVHFLFLCRAGREPSLPGVRTVVLSPRPWGLATGTEMKALLASFHPFRAAGLLMRRLGQEKNREKLYVRAKEVLREIDPDRIVTSHYLVLPGVPEELLPRTIHHVHTSFAATKNQADNFKTISSYKDRIRFLWLSAAIRDKAVSEGFSRSSYLMNPVPFTAPRTRVEEKRKVVVVSRFSPEKRLPLMVELLKKTLPLHWRAEFWGDGEEKEAIRAAIDGDNRFALRGVTGDPKAVFATAAFTVNTSLYEGVPLTILEAAACGVPTLSFRFGEAADEIIRDGETGVLIDQDDLVSMEDALRVLFTSPGWRKTLSMAAHEAARGFALEKVKEDWLALLEEE